MHLAVAQGAKKNETFVSYVDYLDEKHFIPPGAHAWVDHIRKKGNEANHHIVIMSKDEAEELMAASEMLLKNIYEYPAKVNKSAAAAGSTVISPTAPE